MSKFDKFLQILKASESTIQILENAGVDVDKLVHIKHQQGDDAKIISSVLSQVSLLLDDVHDPVAPIKKVAPTKRKKKSSK